jgi:hypothetical protein
VIAVRVKSSTRTGVALVAMLLSLMACAGSAQATSRSAPADPAVITSWNAIAVRTISVEGGKPPPITQLYLGFVSAAVYDAVVAIEGGYEPYGGPLGEHGHRRASSQAAAATAAYRTLAFYFPASAAALAADYQTSLAAIPDGRAKVDGVAVGEDAAALIERLREDDGRDDASILFTRAPAPGVWRPTPPALAPFFAPWLGFVRPLLLSSPTEIELRGPYALTSRRYARDYNEEKDFGSATSTARTPEQTQTALFWNDPVPVQYQAGFRDLATRNGLDIVSSARMFGVLNMATADAAIACWRAKYDFGFWRPITAIALADTDGNPATTPDPTWKPLAGTPAYPEYPSGHACLSGATSAGLSALFGADHIDLNVSNAVSHTARHYETARELNEETINARLWLGLHFRQAMVDGNRLGQEVTAFALDHAFQATGENDGNDGHDGHDGHGGR